MDFQTRLQLSHGTRCSKEARCDEGDWPWDGEHPGQYGPARSKHTKLVHQCHPNTFNLKTKEDTNYINKAKGEKKRDTSYKGVLPIVLYKMQKNYLVFTVHRISIWTCKTIYFYRM